MRETGNTFAPDAGSALAYPVPVVSLRKGGHVVIEGRPGKITDISVRADRVTLTAIDIFTGRKLEASVMSIAAMNVPNIQRADYTLTAIDDGFLDLLSSDGTAKNDLKAPEGDLGREMQTALDDGRDIKVTVISAMGEEAAVAFHDSQK